MAVIKHISVKGSNGGDALNYVLYKHNEKTGELIVDGRGNPVMRDEYYLDGINCEPYSFAAECKEVNDLYGKNQLPGDIKAHHFIISYDPKDGVEHGLTGSKAQQLSMEWAQRCLPGFQILVCTHMDGSNESGNIHTHIMMNSVRTYDTEPEMYGERDIDHKAGYKLHLTDDYLRYMKQELMNICEREGLHQMDLISPAKDRITDKEYHAQQNGQHNLEKQHVIDVGEPGKSVFQTQKQYLRESVMDVASRATSFDSFCIIMKQEYNIMVKESRGRISYLHPERDKFITGRALGTLYEKKSVIQIISGNRLEKESNREKDKNTYSFSIDTMKDCKKVFEMHSDIHLVVRLQDRAKAQLNALHANKVALTHVKMMAETILFIQQNSFKTREELVQAFSATVDKSRHIDDDIRQERTALKSINEDIHYLGQYLAYKRVYAESKYDKNENAISKERAKDLATYRNAVSNLNKKYDRAQFPVMKELKKQKHNSLIRINKLQEQQKESLKQQKRFRAAIKNIDTILGEKHDISSLLNDDIRAGSKTRNGPIAR